MPLEIDRIIDAPAMVVWDQLTRVSQWPFWGPSVIEVECQEAHIRLVESCASCHQQVTHTPIDAETLQVSPPETSGDQNKSE